MSKKLTDKQKEQILHAAFGLACGVATFQGLKRAKDFHIKTPDITDIARGAGEAAKDVLDAGEGFLDELYGGGGYFGRDGPFGFTYDISDPLVDAYKEGDRRRRELVEDIWGFS